MKRFECMLCGEKCCTFTSVEDMPLVFPWEKRRLEKYRKDLVFKPYVVYVINDHTYAVVLYKWIINGVCPFLRSDGRCSIHNEKPLSCKMYPLLVGWDDKTLRVSGACPWITENLEYIKKSNPAQVFPEEFKAAVEVLSILESIEATGRKLGWKRKIYEGENVSLIDIDIIMSTNKT